MTVDPVTVAVALDQDAVFVPFAGCEFLDLELSHNPAFTLWVNDNLLPRVRKNTSALFLVEHTVVLGFVGYHVALVTSHHVEPELGGVGTAVLDTAVASGGDSHLHLEVEVAHGGHLPGNEMVHLERTVGLPGQDSILKRPKLGVTGPTAHSATEETGKTVGSRTVGHGGGRLGVRRRGNSQGTVHGGQRPTQFGHPLIRQLAKLLERLAMLGILGEVGQFVGIVLEVMEELVVVLVDVTDVLVAVCAQALKGGDAMTHREMLVKGLLAPIIRLAG